MDTFYECCNLIAKKRGFTGLEDYSWRRIFNDDRSFGEEAAIEFAKQKVMKAIDLSRQKMFANFGKYGRPLTHEEILNELKLLEEKISDTSRGSGGESS